MILFQLLLYKKNFNLQFYTQPHIIQVSSLMINTTKYYYVLISLLFMY